MLKPDKSAPHKLRIFFRYFLEGGFTLNIFIANAVNSRWLRKDGYLRIDQVCFGYGFSVGHLFHNGNLDDAIGGNVCTRCFKIEKQTGLRRFNFMDGVGEAKPKAFRQRVWMLKPAKLPELIINRFCCPTFGAWNASSFSRHQTRWDCCPRMHFWCLLPRAAPGFCFYFSGLKNTTAWLMPFNASLYCGR